MAASEVQPWERQDGEPELAYEAFKGFVFQTLPRRLHHSSVKHGHAELSTLYNEWRWQERALAYDRYTERQRQAERDAILRQDEKERVAKMVSMLEGVADVIEREMAKLIRDSRTSQAFGLIKPSDLNKLMTSYITFQRLIHGESTENVATVDASLSKLSLDELKELARIQAKLNEGKDDDDDARH